jgi:hypothetical protein
MSAMDRIFGALAGPDGNLSRSDYNAKAHVLSMQWPSLAAAVAELLEEHSMPIPGPLRHAQNVMRQEREKGSRR